MHCGREEAEERAAPQIVSVPAAPAPHSRSRVCSNPSTLQPAVGWMGRVGFLGISPTQDSGLWGGGRLLLGLGKWLNFYQGKGWWEGRVPIRGIRGEGSAPPGRCALWPHDDACSPLPRRHLRSSPRRGTRPSAAPWATTTVSHALLGNFEVTAPTR